STQSNYSQIASAHMTFDWSVDCSTTRIVSGSATHHMNVLLDDVEEAITGQTEKFIECQIRHDTGDLGLSGALGNAHPRVAKTKLIWVQYDLKPKHEAIGSALHVSLTKGFRSGTSIDVTVNRSRFRSRKLPVFASNWSPARYSIWPEYVP
ncbi:hypothetical protein C8F04DRAFT_974523, partial [Mycena alexandri]